MKISAAIISLLLMSTIVAAKYHTDAPVTKPPTTTTTTTPPKTTTTTTIPTTTTTTTPPTTTTTPSTTSTTPPTTTTTTPPTTTTTTTTTKPPKRYELVKELKDWKAAALHCSTVGANGQLVAVTSAEVQQEVVSYLTSLGDETVTECPYGYFWTAGRRTVTAPDDVESEFVWKTDYKGDSDFTPQAITYTNWYPGEPNLMVDTDSCINILGMLDHKWINLPCYYNLCSICVM